MKLYLGKMLSKNPQKEATSRGLPAPRLTENNKARFHYERGMKYFLIVLLVFLLLPALKR